jgi:dUTP pyrophosphatase
MRKFEKISYEQFIRDFKGYKDVEAYDALVIPTRKTKKSAGYDFCAPVSFILRPNDIIRMPTGIKASMNDGEFLMVVVRSSTGFKYNVRICNQVGIIDGDYYNNEQNEGHIWIAFQNEGDSDWVVSKGDGVAQGIFVKYSVVNEEEDILTTRKGGIGSTNIRSDKNE